MCETARPYLVRADLWSLRGQRHASLGGARKATQSGYIHSFPPLPPRATTRNAQISRTKVQEGEEASSQLVQANVAFTKAALVYSMQINEVQLKKGHEVQDRVRRERGEGREGTEKKLAELHTP